MEKRRNRIVPKDVRRNLPKLSDCADVFSGNLYKFHIWATGQVVLVSAPCIDTAVYTLSSWLSAMGFDSRVLLLESFERSDVLSSRLLYASACKICKDDTLL